MLQARREQQQQQEVSLGQSLMPASNHQLRPRTERKVSVRYANDEYDIRRPYHPKNHVEQ